MGKSARLHILFYICLLALSACSYRGGNSSNIPVVQTKNDVVADVRVSLPDTDAAEPAIVADDSGNIYVVYVEHRADKSADVYLQKFNAGMKANGERVRINPEPGEVKAWRGDQPTVMAGAGGKVYVGWNRSVKKDKETGNDLMFSVSSDGGKTFDAQVKINDDTVPASHGMHAMAVAGENVYFTWLDERYLKKEKHGAASKGGEMHHGEAEPNAELYFAVSTDGGKTFSANKKIAADICPCCKAQMTLGKDGKAYISWRQVLPGEFRHVVVTSTADAGETFAEPVVVNDDKWHITACPVSGAPMIAGDDNTLKVAWFTAGEAGAPGLYWAESKDQGRTFSPRALLSEGMVMGTAVMLSGDRVLWNIDGKLFTEKIPSQAATGAVRELGEGELPAGTLDGNSLFLSYIKKESGKRSIWLKRTEN